MAHVTPPSVLSCCSSEFCGHFPALRASCHVFSEAPPTPKALCSLISCIPAHPPAFLLPSWVMGLGPAIPCLSFAKWFLHQNSSMTLNKPRLIVQNLYQGSYFLRENFPSTVETGVWIRAHRRGTKKAHHLDEHLSSKRRHDLKSWGARGKKAQFCGCKNPWDTVLIFVYHWKVFTSQLYTWWSKISLGLHSKWEITYNWSLSSKRKNHLNCHNW